MTEPLDLDRVEIEIRRATDPPDAPVPVLYAAARLGFVLLAECRALRAQAEAARARIDAVLAIEPESWDGDMCVHDRSWAMGWTRAVGCVRAAATGREFPWPLGHGADETAAALTGRGPQPEERVVDLMQALEDSLTKAISDTGRGPQPEAPPYRFSEDPDFMDI